ncbi:SRPBCC family protein [Microbacterium aureliae]
MAAADVRVRVLADGRGAGLGAARWERRVLVETTVHHPVERVFPYLRDPTKWHDFAPAVVFRDQIGDGAAVVGTRWRATDRIGPFRIHFIDELEALDDNRRAVWLSSSPWNSRVEYACDPRGASTGIRADYFGVLDGSLRWQLGWMPDWATHGILAQDFRRLNRLLAARQREDGLWRNRHAAPEPV